MPTLTFVEKYFQDKGIAIGEERGRREVSFETARRLRSAGMSDNDIHKFTDLSFEDIRTL